MCGIHGVINKATYSRTSFEAFLRDGFVAGSLRGMDSSGIMQIDKEGKPYLFKLAIPGPMFIEGKLASRFLRDASSCPLSVAHVRAATAGRVITENAHPFCVDRADGTRVLGVHNGTLTGWTYKKGGKDFDVDSEWALNRIAEEGADAFEHFQGAWALVWWDERTPDKVYVARNNQRPLHFVRTKDKSSMLFASEAGMLAWLAERNQIECEESLYTFEDGKLYTIDMSGSEITWTKVNYPVYKYSGSYTTGSTTTSYGSVANNNRGHWNPGKAKWEDRRSGPACGIGNDGAYSEGDGWYGDTTSSGYPEAHLPASAGNSSKKGGQDELCAAAVEVVEEVKGALRENRDKRFHRGAHAPKKESDTKPVIDEDAIEAALVAEARKRHDEKAKEEDYTSTEFQCKPDWYSDLSARTDEREAARKADVMGELQWFTGIHYESDISELYGEMEDYVIGGKGKVKYDAIMRMASSVEARKYSLPTGKGCWVAIIGKGIDKKYNGTYYVVTPVNSKGLSVLNKTAA